LTYETLTLVYCLLLQNLHDLQSGSFVTTTDLKIGKLPQKSKQEQTRTNKNGHFSFKGRFAQAKRQAVKGLTFDKTFDTTFRH